MGFTYVPHAGEYLSRKTIDLSGLGAGGSSEDLFAVGGDVHVRLTAVCSVPLVPVGAANGSVGIAGKVDFIIPVTDLSLLAVRNWWHDASPDSEIEVDTVEKGFYISDGNYISLDLSAEMTSGTLEFYCYWYPMSDGAWVAETP